MEVELELPHWYNIEEMIHILRSLLIHNKLDNKSLLYIATNN